MKIVIILLLALGIMMSGCMSNPAKQVPIVKVNITFVEKQGTVEPEHYTLIQGTTAYISRPRTTAQPFPAISARATILKGDNSSIGPWEMIPYTGNGTYSFNLGFRDDQYPQTNDTVHISIIVIDKAANNIGYVVKDIRWE